MDRNQGVHYDNYNLHVALRKESVDRNRLVSPDISSKIWVALRKESVDRNLQLYYTPLLAYWSLSARRAWIEIVVSMALDQYLKVALRKESVDRNRRYFLAYSRLFVSLSARRAWIEIVTLSQ